MNCPKDANELQMQGTIESREYYGLYIKYYINVDGQTIKAIEKNDGINIYEPGEQGDRGHPSRRTSCPMTRTVKGERV